MVGDGLRHHGLVVTAAYGELTLTAFRIKSRTVLTLRAIPSPLAEIVRLDVVALGTEGIVVIDIPAVLLHRMPRLLSRHTKLLPLESK